MWFLPSEKYCHIVMVRMVVIFEVHSLLKLTEAFQCVVSMVCYLQLILKSSTNRIIRKQDSCLCKNKGADQLCSNCTADQHLCFCSRDSSIPLLLKSKISSFKPTSVTVQAGLCHTWLKTQKTGCLCPSSNN